MYNLQYRPAFGNRLTSFSHSTLEVSKGVLYNKNHFKVNTFFSRNLYLELNYHTSTCSQRYSHDKLKKICNLLGTQLNHNNS